VSMMRSEEIETAGNFRTFHKARRVPAAPLQPVVDPAGWSPGDLGPVETWSYRITERDIGELSDAVASVRRNRIPIEGVARDNFPLKSFADVLTDVRRELIDGRGIVMLQNFPIDRFDREAQAIAYLGLGTYIGHTMSQNRQGHILGHVKDLGGDYADPNTRGYMTRAEMLFHADACDYVGLLCLHGAKRGGDSRVASSVTVYNRILERRPDLAEVLCENFYRSRSGEVNPGEDPWFVQPIFSFVDGYFSATGAGAAIDKAQKLPGVPPYTPAQLEAVELYRKTVDECAIDIGFEPGDIQFLNNFVTLHTRREYEDWPEESRKRHLLRLWLSDPNGRPIPKEQREGRSGRGVHLKGVKLVAPLDVSVAA
jgi:Taurine catabolism dioxygenase TauD, TfdA family